MAGVPWVEHVNSFHAGKNGIQLRAAWCARGLGTRRRGLRGRLALLAAVAGLGVPVALAGLEVLEHLLTATELFAPIVPGLRLAGIVGWAQNLDVFAGLRFYIPTRITVEPL